ncbi:interleukin-18 isoform X1 [Pelobates fuscus]|uniref:interleukin-18 isoform X1 n=1 Tax=Pelobates fuscus TaxID=191477 RepID=UPI002FE48744
MTMATNWIQYDCNSEVYYLLPGVKDGILCFVKSELHCDSWAKSKNTVHAIILNYFKEALEAHPEDFSGDVATFKKEYDKDRACFKLVIYRDTLLKGFSVAFTITILNKTYYLSCINTKELRFKEGDPPKKIDGSTSDVIFYQKNASKGDASSFVFESALVQGYCLAFKNEDGKHKLTLKRPEDQVDETTHFRTVPKKS